MKIDKPLGTPRINLYAHKKYELLEKTTLGRKQDQLHISEEAKLMLEENQAIYRADQEKVDRLKAEIQNGSYQVDSRKVAERLYEFWFKGNTR